MVGISCAFIEFLNWDIVGFSLVFVSCPLKEDSIKWLGNKQSRVKFVLDFDLRFDDEEAINCNDLQDFDMIDSGPPHNYKGATVIPVDPGDILLWKGVSKLFKVQLSHVPLEIKL